MAQRTIIRGGVRKYDLDKVEERLSSYEEGHEDVLIRASELLYHDDGTIEYDGTKFNLTDWSYGQLAKALEIPTAYLRRSAAEGIGKMQVDRWLAQQGDREFRLRLAWESTTDPRTGAAGRVRALLSKGANTLSNVDLFRTMREFVREFDMQTVLANALPDDSPFHFRVLFPEVMAVGASGGRPDVHQVGFHVVNSEIGQRSLRGDFVVFRQVCTNGMIALVEKEPVLQVRHMGSSVGGMTVKVRTALEVVQARATDTYERLLAAKNAKINNPERRIEAVLMEAKMSAAVIERVQQAFRLEPIPSRFGVMQAVTRAAQGVGVETRVELEALAGRLLDEE